MAGSWFDQYGAQLGQTGTQLTQRLSGDAPLTLTPQQMQQLGTGLTNASGVLQYGGGKDALLNGMASAPTTTSAQPQVAPTRTPTVSPDGSMPLSGGSQDPHAVFTQLTQGKPPTPETLAALEPELQKYGIRVVRNASGTAGKIGLPNGQIVDVIRGAGVGGKAWQWGTGSDGGGANGNFQTGMFTGGGRYPLASVMGSGLAAPWTTPFGGLSADEFMKTPGVDARLKMGVKALQQSAAAKGTLLTGGTLKDLNQFAQDYASNEYDKAYGRQLGEYNLAYGIFNNNQGNLYNRLGGLASMGQNAASGYGSATAGITQGIGGALAQGQQDAGNAKAGGQAASGSIWGNTVGSVGGTLGGMVSSIPFYSTPQPYGGTQQTLPGMEPNLGSNMPGYPYVMNYGVGR